MAKYFVWRYSDKSPYRAFGERNHIEPETDDLRCIWRGDSLAKARKIAKAANKKQKELIE